MDKTVKEAIACRLKAARQGAQLTQKEVARELKLSRQAVSAWECGSSAPTSNELYALGLLYAVSIDYVLYGTKMMPVSGQKALDEVFRDRGPRLCKA